MSLGTFIMVALAAIWIIGIFLGIVTGASKTFKETPANIYNASIKERQQEIVDDSNEKRQEMMDNIRQKIEDNKRY